MKEYPGIIFYGTPEFAVASLKAIAEAGYRILAVVTAPDRPAGRGLKISSSPVKRFAQDHGFAVLQPENLKAPRFLDQLYTLKPDLQIVVAFRMMPEEVWALPPLGTFNLHASLLPQYRGAAPISWAIINGERETGVTTFLLDEKIDTGKILFMEKIAVGPDETAGQLHDRLMVHGAQLVVKTIEALAAGDAPATPQHLILPSDLVLKKAPKIHPADCEVKWDRTVSEVYNLIRGLSPYPGAHTSLLSKSGDPHYIKIYSTVPEVESHSCSPGFVATDGRSYLKIAVKDGWIRLKELQLSGRKPMKTVDFLMGLGARFI